MREAEGQIDGKGWKIIYSLLDQSFPSNLRNREHGTNWVKNSDMDRFPNFQVVLKLIANLNLTF